LKTKRDAAENLHIAFFPRKGILRTLIFGYGNPDRQDDGIAWHVLREVMKRNGVTVPNDLDIFLKDEKSKTNYIFQLQLTPEIAADLVDYQRVCFIDAHTGAVPEEIHFEEICCGFQKSPFTHHLTPSSLLSIAETLHKEIPETILISIRGYEFGFSQSLSPKTAALIDGAADLIMKWLNNAEAKLRRKNHE
jgi:hydrogenase maturation protease